MKITDPSLSPEQTRAIERAAREEPTHPVRLRQVATADLPPAADTPGGLVYDATLGIPSWSNGSAWKSPWASPTFTGTITFPNGAYINSADGNGRFFFTTNGATLFRSGTDTAALFDWRNDSNAVVATLSATYFDVAAGLHYRVGNVQVLGPRITGWGAPTGAATRTAFDTATVTLPQLAERVKALIDDQTTHGQIGP